MKKYTHKTRDVKCLARIIATDLDGKFPVAAAVKQVNSSSDDEFIWQLPKNLKSAYFNDDNDLIEYSFWETIPVDTKILVRDSISENWQRRHFSHYKDGKVYTFLHGTTSWTSDGLYNNGVSPWDFAILNTDE